MVRTLGAGFHLGGWRRFIIAIALGLLAVGFLYASFDQVSAIAPWRPTLPTIATFPSAPLAKACDGVQSTPANKNSAATNAGADAPIPNIVHYIWLLADQTKFSLSFKVFISVYSSHLFLHPDRIYFHTDVPKELWESSKKSGDLWTKRILNIPGVTPKFIENPRVTSKGQEIDTFGAKSDFIRADALGEYGGMYLDVDAIPLRDVAPLRNAGFANVVGGAVVLRTKYSGFVNTGVWLSRPHSSLVEIFGRAMDAFYNGVWAISVDILTDLSFRLHAIPGEVLIMHPKAFAPTSFEVEDQERLFRPHPGSGGANGAITGVKTESLGTTCEDALAWLAEREQHQLPGRPHTEGWEMDFSATYVLHAFDDDADRVRGWDGKITLQYVLAQQSNYARAVYPAVKHAIDEGIITKEETV
ncbi:hypothetical protein B0J18DRAFT_440733 [Chaetomium sp. MPI-SDFR-AT-0129]|nr:hypothetical protein B0J18DRAFT_440733 [Chaetomium sp. MPI-SDFR-AT-0129]